MINLSDILVFTVPTGIGLYILSYVFNFSLTIVAYNLVSCFIVSFAVLWVFAYLINLLTK